MSLESFKEEFYFVSADQVSPKHAIQHALLKWTGLLPENLKKHGVLYLNHVVHDTYESHLPYYSSTCSLCKLYLNNEAHSTCEECPLAKVRNGVRCNLNRDSDPAPYSHDQPYRMIEFLNKALELYGPKPDFVSPTLTCEKYVGWMNEGSPELWACEKAERLFPTLADKQPAAIKIEMYDWWYPETVRFDLCLDDCNSQSFRQVVEMPEIVDKSLYVSLREGVEQALGIENHSIAKWKGSVWIRPVIVERQTVIPNSEGETVNHDNS